MSSFRRGSCVNSTNKQWHKSPGTTGMYVQARARIPGRHGWQELPYSGLLALACRGCRRRRQPFYPTSLPGRTVRQRTALRRCTSLAPGATTLSSLKADHPLLGKSPTPRANGRISEQDVRLCSPREAWFERTGKAVPNCVHSR